MYICIYICIYIDTYTYVCLYIYIYVYLYVYICVYTYIYTHACTHILAFIYTKHQGDEFLLDYGPLYWERALKGDSYAAAGKTSQKSPLYTFYIVNLSEGYILRNSTHDYLHSSGSGRGENFSKISILPNLPWKITMNLTFEKFYCST